VADSGRRERVSERDAPVATTMSTSEGVRVDL